MRSQRNDPKVPSSFLSSINTNLSSNYCINTFRLDPCLESQHSNKKKNQFACPLNMKRRSKTKKKRLKLNQIKWKSK